MNTPDRAPGVRLVTDHPPTRLETKLANGLQPGDHIAVGFGGYGRVVARVARVTPRDDMVAGLVDIDVASPGLDYTTVRPADARETVYPARMYGEWL